MAARLKLEKGCIMVEHIENQEELEDQDDPNDQARQQRSGNEIQDPWSRAFPRAANSRLISFIITRWADMAKQRTISAPIMPAPRMSRRHLSFTGY
jgi:hypothetical protein